jgi:dihydrolipoamide dehydrogenase
VLSAREAVFLEELPEHLIVLGGGVIGLELGTAFLRLGSRLTLLEASDTLLPGVDPDLVRVVQKKLSSKQASVLTSARAHGFTNSASGAILQVTHGDRQLELEGSHVLVATGFVPNSERLGLAELGVRLDARGHVVTNERCESSLPGVYAIGDVAGMPYLAHKAYKEAEVVADALSGARAARDWRALPAAIFCDPEIASVGLSEREARAQDANVGVGRFPFSALDRAARAAGWRRRGRARGERAHRRAHARDRGRRDAGGSEPHDSQSSHLERSRARGGGARPGSCRARAQPPSTQRGVNAIDNQAREMQCGR